MPLQIFLFVLTPFKRKPFSAKLGTCAAEVWAIKFSVYTTLKINGVVWVKGYPRPGVPAVRLFCLVLSCSHVNRTDCFLITATVTWCGPTAEGDRQKWSQWRPQQTIRGLNEFLKKYCKQLSGLTWIQALVELLLFKCVELSLMFDWHHFVWSWQ